jgi:hypothetical protein
MAYKVQLSENFIRRVTDFVLEFDSGGFRLKRICDPDSHILSIIATRGACQRRDERD